GNASFESHGAGSAPLQWRSCVVATKKMRHWSAALPAMTLSRLDEQGELAVLGADLVVERDRVVAGEAGVAEARVARVAAARDAHGAVEAVDRQEGQRVDADELRHAGHVVARGQQLVLVRC